MTDQQAIEAKFREGTLLESIYSSAIDRADILDICVALHNAGNIDLLSLVERGAHAHPADHNFFRAMHFYCKAIPHLNNVPVKRMMGCVAKLVQAGGADLAAGQPNGALIKWCAVDTSRADEIIEQARCGNNLAADHLTFALQAKEDLSLAREIATGCEDKCQIGGLTALSRIPHPEVKEVTATVAAMTSLIKSDADDALRAHILSVVIQAHESSATQLLPEAITVVARALDGPGDLSLHSAAHALLDAKLCLGKELLDLLMSKLQGINPNNEGTINLIDDALLELQRKGFGHQAVEFATKLLSRADGKLRLKQLDGFAALLAENDPATLNGVVVNWLLSGNPQLCEGVVEMVRQRGEDVPLSIDLGEFDLTDTQTYFFCRKAVGYLFLMPIIASSVLVSALRTTSGDVCNLIKALLFDPLLINYGGSLRKYFASLDATDSAYALIQEVLAQADIYIAGLSAAGSIKELHTSEYRRQLERIRMMDFNREVNKKAQRQSIFWDITHRSVLLHGHHSIMFVEDTNGKRKPVEMKLQSIEHSVEWPRMETVDPVGLDMMLRVFRAEEIAS